jgi:tRNA threonylcarbamoyladenosine biosynthesis protein TsaE
MRRIGEPARRSSKSLSPQAEEFDKRGPIQALPRCEVAFATQGCEAVPRAGQLAVVAAVDAIAELLSQGLGNLVLEFDREVGDTQPCIEPVGCSDRRSRTRIDAGRAAAAMVGDRRVGSQRQVGEQFTKEEIRSRLAIQQQGVLAAPAQSAVSRQADLHHRRRVGEGPIVEITHLLADAIGEFLQPGPQQLVVIAAQRVARNEGAAAVGQRLPRIRGVGPVIHARGDNAAGARHEQAGSPLVSFGTRVGGHIIHFAMAARRQPCGEAGLGIGNIDTGKADGIEAEFAAPAPDVFLQPIQVNFIAMHAEHLTLALPDEADTLALGATLAAHLAPGSVVWLEGDLGAGKTTLVRGLLRAAGETGPVKSPTYTLVEVHVVSGLNFYHFDFYRFNQAEEYLDAGLDEYFSGSGVCLVEWPDKAAPYLPPPICESNCGWRRAQQGDARIAVITAGSERGRTCLAGVTSSSSLPPA